MAVWTPPDYDGWSSRSASPRTSFESGPTKQSLEDEYILTVTNHLHQSFKDPSVLCIAIAYVLLRDNPSYSVHMLTDLTFMHQKKSSMVDHLNNVLIVNIPNHKRVFVDLEWSSRWSTFRKTPEYTEFIESLPTYIVCGEDQLKSLLTHHCKKLTACFDAFAMTVPPWRTGRAMEKCYMSSPSMDAAPLCAYLEEQLSQSRPINTQRPPLDENAKAAFAQSLGSLLSAPFTLHTLSIPAPPERMMSEPSSPIIDASPGTDYPSTVVWDGNASKLTEESTEVTDFKSEKSATLMEQLLELPLSNASAVSTSTSFNSTPLSGSFSLDKKIRRRAKALVDLTNGMRCVIDTVPSRNNNGHRSLRDSNEVLPFDKQSVVLLVDAQSSLLTEQIQSHQRTCRWNRWTSFWK